MSAGQVTLAVDGPVAHVVIDQPARHNALTAGMLGQLSAIAAEVTANIAIRAVVVRGAGDRAFSGGADLGAGSPSDSGSARVDISALRRVPVPVIAAVSGWCLGGGLLIALTADLRVAAPGARFGIPAVRLGNAYSLEGMEIVRSAIGAAAAAEVLLLGEQLDEESALRLGIVHRVVDDAFAEAERLATWIAAAAPLTMRAMKAGLAHLSGAPGALDRAGVQALIDRCRSSDDAAEGKAAFAERRPPRFTGH